MSSVPGRQRRRRLLTTAAWVITTALALLLWGIAFWHLATSAVSMFTASGATGDVVSCSTAPIGPGCTVRYIDPSGTVLTRVIDRPGLIGTTEGDLVPLWIAADGSLAVAGWRAWVDAALFLVFAVIMTASAVRWFGQMLREGDALSDIDLRDDGHDARRRDAG